MSENRHNIRPPRTLGEGFALLRLAVGDELEKLALDLQDVAARDPALEVRYPVTPEGKKVSGGRSPGVQIVGNMEIKKLNLRDRNVPVSAIYDDLDSNIPTLGQSMKDVQLTIPHDKVENENDLFIMAALDDDSAESILMERALTFRQALRAGGVMNRRELYLPEPQITIAYLGRAAHRGTMDEVYSVLDDHLPINATLLPAVKHPHISVPS